MKQVEHSESGAPKDGADLSRLLLQFAARISDAILAIDRDWHITYMNPEAMRLGRLTEREYTAGTFWDHYPDLRGSEIEHQYRRVMQTGESFHTEYWYSRFEVWIDLQVVPADEGIVLFYRDITAIKQARTERDVAQQMLSRVMDSITEGVVMLDREFRFTYLNGRAEKTIGPGSTVLGQNIWSAFPAMVYDRSPFLECYQRAMHQRETCRFEAFYPEPLNAWFSIEASPVEDGIVIFFRDITQEKLDREILAQQHDLLVEAQRFARIAVWEIDPETRMHRFSPASAPIYGRPLRLAVPSSEFETWIAPEHRERVQQSRRRALETGQSTAVEFQCVSPTGERFWLEGRMHAVERPGQPTLIRGLTLDITARKQAEMDREAALRLLDQVMHATTEGVLSIDRQWAITYLNPRGKEMLVSSVDFLGQNFWESFPLSIGTGVETAYRRAMDERFGSQFETFYAGPYRRWYRIDVRPSEDGIIVFFRDITLEKTARRALDQQAELLNGIQQDVQAAIWNLDLRTDLLTFHPGSYPVFGHPNEKLATWDAWKSVVCWPDSSALDLRHAEITESGKTLKHEWQVLAADGTRRWVETRSTAVYEDGAPVALRGIALDVTDEKLVRQALEEERATLEHVHQTSRAASWRLELSTGRLFFVPGSYPVYGWPAEDIATLADFQRILHPEDAPRISESLRHAISSGEPMVNEFRVRASDGRILWVETRSQVAMQDGRAIELRGLAIDIGDRKRGEEALRESEERYRVLAELNPQALWMGSPDGHLTYANQGFLDYLGLTLENLDHWILSVDPADRVPVVAAWTHSVRTGENFDVEARMLRSSDNASRWWWLRAKTVRDASGAILHWLGVAMDIHDRRSFADALLQKQEETERQRAELETVYSTAPIGLALFDAVEFRYLQLNDRQAEIIGLPKDQVLGRTLTEIAPIEGLHEMFVQVASGKPIVNQLLEGELPMQPGVHRYWTVNYFPVYDRDGTIRAISAATLEITNQKRAENALIQSEKLAAVGRLATSISHEINNPLEAITNLLYLISADSTLPEDTRTYVGMAQSELARVCQIATQTLRFHRQAVGPTYISAGDLVTAVLNLYQGRLINSGIDVRSRFSDNTRILCFENDIRQVLNNLISNAIDAMKNGGQLLVRSHNAVTYDFNTGLIRRGIRIVIADTGHGISPDVMTRMFEPFYTTKDLNGTGLGLWISEGIVQRHYGRLAVRSRTSMPLQGTVFSLFLPLVEGSAAALQQKDSHPA